MIKHGFCASCGAYTAAHSYVEGTALRAERPDEATDEELLEQLQEALGTLGVDLSGVRLTVLNGAVTLRGEVATKREKQVLADVAYALPAVLDVHNHLSLGGIEVPSPS